MAAPYFRSLMGTTLYAGCERTPFALTVGAALIPGYLGFQATLAGAWIHGPAGMALGLGIFIGGIAWLRWLARKEPMAFRLWLRNRRYRRFYPAKASLWARTKR
jgi:type IV secretory pathway TrbD component